jgi:hypothetical protein
MFHVEQSRHPGSARINTNESPSNGSRELLSFIGFKSFVKLLSASIRANPQSETFHVEHLPYLNPRCPSPNPKSPPS